jgi:hypothetical protein
MAQAVITLDLSRLVLACYVVSNEMSIRYPERGSELPSSLRAPPQ